MNRHLRRLLATLKRWSGLDICDPGELAALRDNGIRLARQNRQLTEDRNGALRRAETAEAEAQRLLAENDRLRAELSWAATK